MYFPILCFTGLLVLITVSRGYSDVHFERCYSDESWKLVNYETTDEFIGDVISASINSCVALLSDSYFDSGSLKLNVYVKLYYENSGLNVITFAEDGILSSFTYRGTNEPEWSKLSFPIRNDTLSIELHGSTGTDEILIIDSIEFIPHDLTNDYEESHEQYIPVQNEYLTNELKEFLLKTNYDNNIENVSNHKLHRNARDENDNTIVIDIETTESNENSEETISTDSSETDTVPTTEDSESDTTTEIPTTPNTEETTTNSPEPTNNPDNDSEDDGLSLLVIILISVAVIIFLALLGACAYCFGKRKAKLNPLEDDFNPDIEPPVTITIPRVRGIFNTRSISPTRFH